MSGRIFSRWIAETVCAVAVAAGVSANFMSASHTREEFVLDFLNMWQPQGIIVSRIITSPGHLKRIVAALTENLKKYEEQFGEIKEASKDLTENKSSTSGYKIGF